MSELEARLHAFDRETIRKYANEIVPALERRIVELEIQLNHFKKPCVHCDHPELHGDEWND